MWDAIQYVSSGLTLAAFLAAVGAWLYRQRGRRTEHMIRAAEGAERAALVSQALERFHVDTSNLTKSQQHDIALREIQASTQRFFMTFAGVLVCCLVAMTVALFAIVYAPTDNKQSSSVAETRPSHAALHDPDTTRLAAESRSSSNDTRLQVGSKRAKEVIAAVEASDVESLKKLVTPHAARGFRNSDGDTLLHRAAFHGHANVIQIMLKMGVSVNARNEDRMTALHIAARRNHLEAVKQLVSSGADISARETRGRTASELAADRGYESIVEYLKNSRAEP